MVGVLATMVGLLSVAASLPAILFIVTYSFVDWRRTAMGRHMMSFMAVWSAIFVLVIVHHIFGSTYPGHLYVSLAAWSAINFIFWWRWVILVRVIKGKYPAPVCPHCGQTLL